MDTRNILDSIFNTSQQVAGSGTEMVQQASAQLSAGGNQSAMLKGAGAGALAAGAVAMMFGSKGSRKFAKKAITLGGTAALGGLAYKAYGDWQATKAAPQVADIGTPINALPPQQASVRSAAIVQAMISAARVDGHIDELEQARITRHIKSLGMEQDVTQFLLAELNQPLDATRIARLADSPEAAAEIYLVSAMFIDYDKPLEREYLAALASCMGLEPGVVQQLEAQLDSQSMV